MEPGTLLLLVGGILAVSMAVALGAARLGVPTLVAFLALGMLLGSDGPGGIDFDDAELARTVGIAGLAAILYEGGLSTSWRRLRRVAVPAGLGAEEVRKSQIGNDSTSYAARTGGTPVSQLAHGG